jgi:hypothetical protein
MKSINYAISGLASSLLLNVGLTNLAEKLDTVRSLNAKNDAASEDCVWLCAFQAESGR